MVMYNFLPPFREAKFCGVPSCVFDKLGCAAGEKMVAEHCYTTFRQVKVQLSFRLSTKK
jgi:hypothetical protein